MAKIRVSSRLTALCRTRPCMIITTLHADGGVNAGTFGAYTNVGPAEIGIAMGKRSHTYQNIQRTGEFVINIPNIDWASALEVCGRSLPPSTSEVAAAGMSTEPAAEIGVPLIAECVANIECKFWQELDVGYHSFVVGKAVAGHIEEGCVDVDGGLDAVGSRVVLDIRYPEPLYATLGEVTRVEDPG